MANAAGLASELSGGNDVHGSCGAETAVGGDQWEIEHDGQLDVQGVDQSQLMAPRPGADEMVTHIVALNRGSDEVTEPGLDVMGRDVTGTMQSSQGREDLGVEVRGCVQHLAR